MVLQSKFDDTRWSAHRALISGTPSTPTEVSIYYVECPPKGPRKGTLLLIHGFPETSYQFRHVITPFADAGYHVVAPDYRGAGNSSHPRNGFEKVQMAQDLHDLLTKHIKIPEDDKVHVVGHDIGGMVAHAYATRFPAASVAWGECPLPGTKPYDQFCRENAGVWHFHFHWQTDLPELLTFGREKEYIRHFYDRLGYNLAAINDEDAEHYARAFSRAGGMRCGFDVYRAFHADAEANKEHLQKNGKCQTPCLTLNGDESFLAGIAADQAREMYENVQEARVPLAGHWCAEENPAGFVEKVLDFIKSI